MVRGVTGEGGTSRAGPFRLVLLICLVFAAVRMVHPTAPYLRHQETVSVDYHTYARSFIRLGLLETRLGNVGISAPDSSVFDDWRNHYYVRRPPTTSLCYFLAIRLLGDAEWVTRLEMTFVGLVSVLAFWGISRRICGDYGGVVATAFFAFMPMHLYFGLVVSHFAHALCFSLVAWYGAVRWNEGTRFRVLMFSFAALSCVTDWPAYYHVLAMALFLYGQGKRAASVGLLGTAGVCIGLVLAHIWLLEPQGGSLLRSFFEGGFTSLTRTLDDERLRPSYFFWHHAKEAGLNFTAGVLILSAVGIVRFWRGPERRFLLLAIPALEVIIFREQAVLHDYILFGLSPFMALTAAAGLQRTWAGRSLRPFAAALVLVCTAQAAWRAEKLLGRLGGNEVFYKAGVAIHEQTLPSDKVLLAMEDTFTYFYADRYVISLSQTMGVLQTVPGRGKVPMRGVDELRMHLQQEADRYTVIVVGAAERAEEIEFFRREGISGERLRHFWFFSPSDPLRVELRQRFGPENVIGAFAFYRVRS